MNEERVIKIMKDLERRREMACYQRKITTELATVIDYDIEIGSIDRRLEQLRYQLKKERKGASGQTAA